MNECINRYFCRPWWDLIFYIIESPALKRWAIAIKTLLELSKSLFALSGIQPKMRDYAVRVEANATARNRVDGEVRRLDKGSVGKGIDPEEGATYSSGVGLQNPPHAPWQKRIVQRIVTNRKMTRLFLIGMLCGVIITTAFTYVFAIPANSDYWRWEIWKRGGGAWTLDMRSGHRDWKWTVEPLRDNPPAKRAVVPPSQTKVRTEQL